MTYLKHNQIQLMRLDGFPIKPNSKSHLFAWRPPMGKAGLRWIEKAALIIARFECPTRRGTFSSSAALFVHQEAGHTTRDSEIVTT